MLNIKQVSGRLHSVLNFYTLTAKHQRSASSAKLDLIRHILVLVQLMGVASLLPLQIICMMCVCVCVSICQPTRSVKMTEKKNRQPIIFQCTETPSKQKDPRATQRCQTGIHAHVVFLLSLLLKYAPSSLYLNQIAYPPIHISPPPQPLFCDSQRATHVLVELKLTTIYA